MEFSNREIATGILIVLGLILLVAISKDRRSIGESMVGVLKALSAWKLLVPLALYILYALAVVVIANTLGWWDGSLLSTTILTILATALPLFINVNDYATGTQLVKKVVIEVVGISAILITYLNLGEFPILGEVLLQAVLLVVVLLASWTPRKPEETIVVQTFKVILTLIVITLLITTTTTVVNNVGGIDWLHESKAFALSIWLPVALIPFLYVTALTAAIEMAIVRLRLHNDRKSPPLRVRLALIFGFHSRLLYAKRFSGLWITEMSAQRTFHDGRAFMRKYRSAVQARVAEQRARDRQIKERTGQRGVDEQGLWLDRREFYETRNVLENIWFMQAAIFRNQGKYTNESFLISSFDVKNLPKEHGIEIDLAKNARSWFAWRKTAGGYYFAVGGSKDVDAHWQYDGSEKPIGISYPSSNGWVNITTDEKHLEWRTHIDQPISLV